MTRRTSMKNVEIIGVYKITNTITGDFYIGSSKDVKRRFAQHKWLSVWKRFPNNPLYLDMQKYGVDKFSFQIIAEVEPGQLKEVEQQLIETLKPTYNSYNANGWNVERYKETRKEYGKEYRKTDKYKKYKKEYNKSDKRKKYLKEYNNQLCSYNGETLTINALRKRFWSQGIPHPTAEVKKYLIMSNR